MTIKQLAEVQSTGTDDPIYVDGEEIKNVTFVGVVRNINQQPIHTLYSIEDGTGLIEVRVWAEDSNRDGGAMDYEGADGENSNQLGNQGPYSDITTNKYVRVYGELKFYNNKRNVTAHKIRLVTDHNEVTYHGLEAAYVHMTKTKGPAPALGGGMGAPPRQGMAPAGMYSSSAAGGGGVSGGVNDLGLNPIQAATLQLIRGTSNDPRGLDISTIQQKLGGQFPSAEITKALDFLIMEGHLYNTTDENHFQST